MYRSTFKATLRYMMCLTDAFSDSSRAVLAALKARRDLKILEWEMALKVQAAWRGRVAKMMVMTMRILRVSDEMHS